MNRKVNCRDSEYQQDRISGRKADGRYCVCQNTVGLDYLPEGIKRRCPLHGLRIGCNSERAGGVLWQTRLENQG